MAENQSNREGGKTVYVDDQPVTLDEPELTIRRLLELAGTPAEVGEQGEAVLRELRDGEEIKHENLEETIIVSEEARFYTRNATPGGSEQAVESFRSESTNLETGTTSKAGVNTSTFAGASRGGAGAQQQTPGQRGPNTGPTSGGQQKQNVGGTPQPSTGVNVRGGLQTPDTATPRGTIPGQGVQSPKIAGQQGSAVQGGKNAGTEQTRPAFNEGEKQQEGSRRSGERKEGRPAERKTEETET